MTPNRLILPIHTSWWKRNSPRQLEKYIDFTYFRNSKGLMNQGAFQPYAFHVLVQLKQSGSNCMASLFWDVNIHLSGFPGTKFLFWNHKRCNSWHNYINIRLFCWLFAQEPSFDSSAMITSQCPWGNPIHYLHLHVSNSLQ